MSDICSQTSLQETLKWKSIVEENCDQIDGRLIPTMVVQNKSDLVEHADRQEFQTQNYLDQFAKEHGFLGGVQTSAKENQGLKVPYSCTLITPHHKELFQRLIQEIIDRGLIQTQQDNYKKTNNMVLKTEQTPQTKGANPFEKQNKSKGGCC